MPSPAEGLHRLRAGFEAGGYRVVSWQGAAPCRAEVRDEKAGGETLRYSIFLHPLSSREPREGSAYASLISQARGLEPGEGLLTLGYEPVLDVFVGWPSHDAGGRWRERLWVPWRALNEAAETGFAEPLTSSIAFAFRPEKIRRYLRIHAEAPKKPGSIVRPRRAYEPSAILYGDFEYLRGLRVEGEEPAVAAPVEEEAGRPEVETGLSNLEEPTKALSHFTALEQEREYLFWFGIGAEMEGSIETRPTPPPEDLPEGATLSVQLFPFADEIELVGPTGGEIELDSDGRSSVVRAAGGYRDERGGEVQRLLFFPIRTAASEGEQRFRCNLYYGSTLLQSRLVTCRVGQEFLDRPALASDLDYAIASIVDHEVLARVPPHDLSVMVNGGGLKGAPTHEFRFFHADGEPLVADASLLAPTLSRAIAASRGTLRQASWATKEEWDGEKEYRYEHRPGNQSDFKRDLIRMAIEGHRLYTAITRKFSGEARRDKVKEAVRKPCRIQIAASDSGLYVPAALFYDRTLETSPTAEEEIEEFELCGEFTKALDAPAPLESVRCMEGACPNQGERYVVCPGGFWGYRHEIGWLPGTDEAVTEIDFDGQARLAIGVSTDPKLELRQKHVKRVLAMGKGSVAESRDSFRDLVRGDPAHLVYLYCHGGLTKGEGMPFLELGPPNSPGLDSPYLVDEGIRWGEPPPRPIVFINGCHTTALDPESLADLVGGFVEDANAVGVLGTEITVFEPLACDFAESVLGNFLDGSMTIGAAIRRSRLDLLRARNPLGLVYVPFVAAATRLVQNRRT